MTQYQSIDLMKGPTLRKFLRLVESNSTEIRSAIGLGDIEPLNPRQCADKLKLVIASTDNLSSEQLDQLLRIDVKQWSGMSRALPDGNLFILLNPRQTPERETVTIMEEYAHHYYGHSPVSFGLLNRRIYDQANEQEAYQTAAAILLPMKVISCGIWRQRSAVDIAKEYGVSVELVEMRIKLLNLWTLYKK